MTLNQIKELLQFIAAGNATKAQEDAFVEWLDNCDKADYQEAIAEWERLLEQEPVYAAQYPALTSRIEASLNKADIPVIPLYGKEKDKRSSVNWKMIAASVILILAMGSFFYFGKDKLQKTASNHQTMDIKPGGNNAVLILGDGSEVNLNSIKNGEVAMQAGIKVEKRADGQLIYTIVKNAENRSKELFNTIQTPIGGQYRINLPDGSLVWLNAASSLRYPTSFSGDERRVELIGEAYFEIAKDKARPFRVVSHQQTVEVLGTHFNVNSYEDEDNTRTTLLEGGVKIYARANKETLVLKPGQQSQVSANSINVKDVDASDAAAWKDGYFVFNAESIPSAMRKIARWYDLEISYEGDINQDLAGSVSRFTNVSEVLKTLELTGLVHFKVDGRKVRVIAN
ncbi:FecR family protein [Pedobacter nyackensis]|uniref:FecR family protein n=1 Tax=Pedobacter nyackensis TaxID=475255 RepID=A0A1W2AH62_9SPHI|nr:FecR family protein [Pedobacter nyackensis]SMC59910.1 FecR family protein [Pedobacter nyackensis]